MKKLFDLFMTQDDPNDWIARMRVLTQGPIGPRYPTGLFTIYNPEARDE